MEKKKLEVGEKYVKIVISQGGVDFEYVAYQNKERTKENRQPHFKGRNVALWANVKKEPKVVKEEVIL